jgi:uncharacterized protein (DUF2336 family)
MSATVTANVDTGSPEQARVRLGADPSAPPALLEQLVADPAVTVRAALALNPAAPAHLNQALARDTDERVRTLLAQKLATLAPGLSTAEQGWLENETHRTLIALIEDEAVRVRATIAEVVKQMPDAPRGLILRLARDIAVSVSEPIIRFSPLLATEDLLALIGRPPTPTTLVAIARRPDLNPRVSDAIAAEADNEAIRTLLSNHSAQIREATLDALIARAAEHEEWHEPLVRRPSLPPHSARALSMIVATCLLRELASRADLPPKLCEELQQRLARKLAEAPAPVPESAEHTTEQAIAEAHRLMQRGRLTELAVHASVRNGERRLAVALLAVAAGVPVTVVDRAASLRSAKGLVSLVWKAGFSMQLAAVLQTFLAQISPSALMQPGRNAGYPLAAEEMRWQVDFLRRIAR